MIPLKTKLEVIRLWQEGKDIGLTKAEIARQTGVSENGVKAIITRIASGSKEIERAKAIQDIIEKRTTPRTLNIRESNNVVLAIPDLHSPFIHPDAMEFVKAVRNKYKANVVLSLGDELDAHAYSRWPKNPDGYSAGHELQAAIEGLIPFYREFPVMQVCVSNHTIRPQKMMKDMGIPSALWPSYSTMLNAPDGWTWHDHIIIDGVRYMHGDQGKTGMQGWTKNSEVYHQSVVVGHWHSKAGVYWDSDMFNLNAGCLIDASAYAFDYARHSHKKPNLGCGIVINGEQAHFIPMITGANGRWTWEL
jgi:predicted phosphodiesterase